MASHITGTLCRQARSIGRLQTLSQNHFVSQSSLIQLCLLRNFATKKMGLPRVFFDMAIDNEPAGRFIVEVSEYSTEINLFFSHKFHELHNSLRKILFFFFFLSSQIHLLEFLYEFFSPQSVKDTRRPNYTIRMGVYY